MRWRYLTAGVLAAGLTALLLTACAENATGTPEASLTATVTAPTEASETGAAETEAETAAETEPVTEAAPPETDAPATEAAEEETEAAAPQEADYTIVRTDGEPDWNSIPVLTLDNIQWQPDCGIRAQGQLCYDDAHLYVHLSATEQNIKAEYTEPLSPVYRDSCLEFFFMPADGDQYFNFEINPNGCLYIGFGHGREDTAPQPHDDMTGYFDIRSGRTADGWEVFYTIPLDYIREYYPDYQFAGSLRANIYKCGDETAQKHYLTWHEVGTEKPDYHRPEYFGTMVFAE